MIYILIKTIIAWLTMMFISTNLIGVIVRGLVYIPHDPIRAEDDPLFREMVLKDSQSISRGNNLMTVLFILFALAFYFALYYFFNVGLVIAAIMLMLSRLPYLLFEIRTGEKLTSKNSPKKPIYIIAKIVAWLALPLIFLSFSNPSLFNFL